MSRIDRFVLTVSLLIFIMISAVACGTYTQMVKERVYGLKQSVIDTTFAVADIAGYRRSVAINFISTLNPTEEQLLVGLRTAYADSVSPPYLYNVGPYLISSDECIQIKKFEKNYYADIMWIVKHRRTKNTGSISSDGKTFVYYLYLVTHSHSLIFLLGLERFSLLSKSPAMGSENLVLSLFRNGKSVTGDKYNARNATFTVSEAMEHFSYLLTGLYVFAYRRDVYLRVCTLIIFFAVLVAVTSSVSCLCLVRRVVNRGIVEEEAIINNHLERVLDGGFFFSAADTKELYSMYNPAFLDNLTKAVGRKSSDEDLRVLPGRDGYLCLFDIDKFKNTNDTFGHLLGGEVLMKVVKILKSQIPVDKSKVYRFGGDESAMTHTGGALEELPLTLREVVYFQMGSINLGASIDVAHLNEYITVKRLKMSVDERLYRSKRNGGMQISWQ